MVLGFGDFLIVWMTTWRWFSCDIDRPNSWVSIFKSLRTRFVGSNCILNNSGSWRVKNFISDILSKGSIDLSWEASGSTSDSMLAIFSCNSPGGFWLVKATVNYPLIFHHIHAHILHVHVGDIKVRCSHANHRAWISTLRCCSIKAFINSLIIFARSASCEESFEERFFGDSIKNSTGQSRWGTSVSMFIFISPSCGGITWSSIVSLYKKY